MSQTSDESGYFVCNNNLRTDVDSDIVKDISKGKVGKHVEVKLWVKDLLTLQKSKEEEYYSYCSIHINIVDIYGVVVGVKSNKFGILYKVDDGTGEIDCWFDIKNKINTEQLLEQLKTSDNNFEADKTSSGTSMESSTSYQNTEVFSITFDSGKDIEVEQWLRKQILDHSEKNALNLGTTVQVRGKLADFRGERCIRIYNIRHVTDINEETDRRFELVHLYQTVYSQNKNYD